MAEILTQLPDELGVERWRYEQFLKLTGSEMLSKLLSLSPNADIEKARRMMKAGCTVEQLARILV